MVLAMVPKTGPPHTRTDLSRGVQVVEPSPEMPELALENGVYIVTIAYAGDLAALRYRVDRWSVRVWRTGDQVLAQYVRFAAPVDPTTRVVHERNGVVEFVLALANGSFGQTSSEAGCAAQATLD